MEDKNIQNEYDYYDLVELKEITDKIKAGKTYSQAELKILYNKIKEDVNFDKILNELDEKISNVNDKRMILVDGTEALYYDNGEFYLVSTTDSTKVKKKLKKDQAKELYLEFFIKYILNPMLDKNKIQKVQLKQKNKEDKKITENEKTKNVKEDIEVIKQEVVEQATKDIENDGKQKEISDKEKIK